MTTTMTTTSATDRDDPAAVAHEWASTHGRPPSLDELVAALAWRRDVGRRRLRALVRDGVLAGDDHGLRPAVPANGLDATDRRLLAYVARHRARQDAGPTWAEVRTALGVHLAPFAEYLADQEARHPERSSRKRWRKAFHKRRADDVVAIRIRALAEAGWLVTSPEPRSLDLGPRAQGMRQ
jgi:hypothetical protein